MTIAHAAVSGLLLVLAGQPQSDLGYSRSDGPVELCHLSAPSIPAMLEVVQAAGFEENASSEEFTQYQNADRDFVFSRPGYSAHPLVTCRQFVEVDGALTLRRQMRCDADRAACDTAMTAFNEMDQQMIAWLRAGATEGE